MLVIHTLDVKCNTLITNMKKNINFRIYHRLWLINVCMCVCVCVCVCELTGCVAPKNIKSQWKRTGENEAVNLEGLVIGKRDQVIFLFSGRRWNRSDSQYMGHCGHYKLPSKL